MRFSQIRRRYRKEEAAGGSPQQTKSARVTKSTKGKKAKAAGKGRDESDSPDDDEDMKPVTKKELKDDAAGVIKIEDGDDDEVIATQKWVVALIFTFLPTSMAGILEEGTVMAFDGLLALVMLFTASKWSSITKIAAKISGLFRDAGSFIVYMLQ